MPRMLWPGCWALWAALAAVDDIVDSRTRHPTERAAELQAWVNALDAELATGTSTDMVRRALVDTIVRWGLDVADLRASFQVLAGDLHPAPLLTWDDWRARSRGMDSAWARQILVLLDRAGVDMSVALRHGEAISRFLDGVQLIDDLADLAEDLGERPLTIPAEVLDRFPGAAEDLPQRRWTMPVQGVLAHLASMARHWVDQPSLGVGWHPGRPSCSRPRAAYSWPGSTRSPRPGPACCTPHPSLGGSPSGGSSRLPGSRSPWPGS